MAILLVKEFYNYWCECAQCGAKMMYNEEDIISPPHDLDYIICPACHNKIYF